MDQAIRNRTFLKQVLFHPLTIVVVALIAAFLFVLLMLPLARFSGDGRFFLLYYHAPIGVAFVVYLFDRAEHFKALSSRQWLIEVAVIALALSRIVVKTPFFSGHALFLSYAILAASSSLPRWIAALVLLDVAYIKIFLLQDATLWGGIIIGILAAIFVRIRKVPSQDE